MRVSIVVFLFVIAGAYALPKQQIETKNEHILTDEIRRAIEQIRGEIIAAGLDPLYIDRFHIGLWMTPLHHREIFIDQLNFTGASNIVINQLSYDTLQNSVKFTFSIPELRLSINESYIIAYNGGPRQSFHLNGSLIIRQVSLAGDVRLSEGILSDISIRSVSLQFSIGEIQSNLRFNAFGNDYTDELNLFLGTIIPEFLDKYKDEINQGLSKIVLYILRQNK